jgi:hypothetical protein
LRRKHKTNSLLFVFKTLVIAAAYYYIYYRITNSVNQDHSISFTSVTPKQSLCIFLALVLVVPNWLLEAIKWKKLLSVVHKTPFLKSVKSVVVGITCSIFTPYRLGEYFGRPIILPKEKRAQGILANMIGSISQNIVTYGLGMVGTILLTVSEKTVLTTEYQKFAPAILIAIIIFLLLFYFNPSLFLNLFAKTNIFKKNRDKLSFISRYTKKELLFVLLIGFARYFTFFLQYYLLLLAFDIQIHILEAFTAISLSYVFLFSIPGIPIADIGIRGSLALFFLGLYSTNEIGIVVASSLLWVLNLAIPAIIGSVFLIHHKKKVK